MGSLGGGGMGEVCKATDTKLTPSGARIAPAYERD